MRRFVIILLLCVIVSPAGAQGELAQPEPGYAPTPLAQDTVATAPREVPHAALDAFRNDPAYTYAAPRREAEGLRARLWRWITDNVLQPLFDRTPAGAGRWALYALLAAAVVFALVRLLGAGQQGGLGRASRTASLDRALAEQGIEAVDLDAWLGRALASGAHREAVRVYYLQALQALAGAQRIAWSPEKTNRAYLAELRDADEQQPFARFTDLFERAWYGASPVGPVDVDTAAAHADLLRSVAGPRR